MVVAAAAAVVVLVEVELVEVEESFVETSASGFFFGSGCTGALPNPLFLFLLLPPPPPAAACSTTSDVCVDRRVFVFMFVVAAHELKVDTEKADAVGTTALEMRMRANRRIIPVEYKDKLGDFMTNALMKKLSVVGLSCVLGW